MDAFQSKTSSLAKVPPTFLTIAGELRNQIYSYLLVQEAILYPYDNKPCGPDCPKHHRHEPNVAILSVNKQINAEATPILYSNATFRLTTGHSLMRFLNNGDHVCMFQSPTLESIYPSRHLIRNLQIKFVPEHTPAEFRDQRNVELWGDPDFRTKTTSERAQLLHQSDRDLSEMVWFNAGVTIPRLRGLQVLTLDVEQCFCPMGCCRMISQVITSLDGLKTKKGIELVVKGGLVPGEEQKIRNALKCVLVYKPTKPCRDPILDAQHIRDVFEGLYSSNESAIDDDSLEDEEDSEGDDEEDETEDEDDSEHDGEDEDEDEEDSDEDEDKDDSSDSETSGGVDEDVSAAKVDVEMLETSLCVTDIFSPSEIAAKTPGVNQTNGPGSSSTDNNTANKPCDETIFPNTTSNDAAPATTDKAYDLRVLSSEGARRLMVTVNPTSAATDLANHSTTQRHNRRRLSKQGKAAIKRSDKALLESIRPANPTLPSLSSEPSHTGGPSASSNYDSDMEDLIDLGDNPNLDIPTSWSTS